MPKQTEEEKINRIIKEVENIEENIDNLKKESPRKIIKNRLIFSELFNFLVDVSVGSACGYFFYKAFKKENLLFLVLSVSIGMIAGLYNYLKHAYKNAKNSKS